MQDGSSILAQSGIEVKITSERYADMVISSLKDRKYRYGLYCQEDIPFLLFDFKIISFAVPVIATDIADDQFESWLSEQQPVIHLAFSTHPKFETVLETTLDLGNPLYHTLIHQLSDQRSRYQDTEDVHLMIKRLGGMISAEYMIRNSAMDTPWPYKAFCRKLVPGRFWFTRKLSKTKARFKQ